MMTVCFVMHSCKLGATGLQGSLGTSDHSIFLSFKSLMYRNSDYDNQYSLIPMKHNHMGKLFWQHIYEGNIFVRQ